MRSPFGGGLFGGFGFGTRQLAASQLLQHRFVVAGPSLVAQLGAGGGGGAGFSEQSMFSSSGAGGGGAGGGVMYSSSSFSSRGPGTAPALCALAPVLS
jgi:hypothetical protein